MRNPTAVLAAVSEFGKSSVNTQNTNAKSQRLINAYLLFSDTVHHSLRLIIRNLRRCSGLELLQPRTNIDLVRPRAARLPMQL